MFCILYVWNYCRHTTNVYTRIIKQFTFINVIIYKNFLRHSLFSFFTFPRGITSKETKAIVKN